MTALRAFAGAAALFALAACPGPRESVEGGPAHPRGVWFAHDPASIANIDHGAWDAIVSKYLKVDPRGDGVNRFDYAAVSGEDRQRLKDYLGTLGKTDIAAYNRDEQIAFWMNLYNAAIADLVLDNAPVGSIRDIPGPGIGVFGPWRRPVATIYGRAVSFDDIEHRILRVAFNDMGIPIHYGVNCASEGWPAPRAARAHGGELAREPRDHGEPIRELPAWRPFRRRRIAHIDRSTTAGSGKISAVATKASSPISSNTPNPRSRAGSRGAGPSPATSTTGV